MYLDLLKARDEDDTGAVNEGSITKTLKEKICHVFDIGINQAARDKYASAASYAQIVKVPDDVWNAIDGFMQDVE